MPAVNRGPVNTAHRGHTAAQPSPPQPHQHRGAVVHQPSRRSPAGPINVLTGSRVSPSHASSLTSASERSSAVKSPPRPSSRPAATSGSTPTSSTSLPTILAGLSGGVLLAAAATNLCSPDHTTIMSSAMSAVAPLNDFEPADVMFGQSLGPFRPVLSLLLHTTTAPAPPPPPSFPQTVAAALQHPQSLLSHLHMPFVNSEASDGGGHQTTSAGDALLSQARDAAEDATSAVRGVVGGLCDDYNRWLEESPLMCKVVTGNFFTIAGDMLAQLGLGGEGGHGGAGEEEAGRGAAGSAAGRRPVDLMRTARLCLETSMLGTPLAHWWFNLLDSRIMPEDPHCPAAVMTKMLADQLLFAPLGLVMFFAAIKCLEGRPRDLPHTLRTSYVKTLLGGYLLWPAAGILNFALLPNEYRLLFNNCVNIIWTCFLSIMSSSSSSSSSSDDSTNGAPSSAVTTAPPSPVRVAAPVSSPCPSSPATSPPPPPCPVCSPSPCAASGIANDLATAAVTAAVISAAAGGRPAFGCVAGIAVAAMAVSLEAHGSAHQAAGATMCRPLVEQQPVAHVAAAAAAVTVAVPCEA